MKSLKLYSVGQEIFFSNGGSRGGVSSATITKVGRRYCSLNNKRLRLDMELGRVCSTDGDWTYPLWESKEAYELEINTNKLWDEIKQTLNKPYSRPKAMSMEILQKIKSILDEI